MSRLTVRFLDFKWRIWCWLFDDSARNDENEYWSMKIKERISISGRWDELRSNLWVFYVKIYCVIALTFRLVYDWANVENEKLFFFFIFIFRPVCTLTRYIWSIFFVLLLQWTNLWVKMSEKLHRLYRMLRNMNDINLTLLNKQNYATNLKFFVVLVSLEGKATRIFSFSLSLLLLESFSNHFLHIFILFACFLIHDHPENNVWVCCFYFFIFAKIILKSIHISGLWK